MPTLGRRGEDPRGATAPMPVPGPSDVLGRVTLLLVLASFTLLGVLAAVADGGLLSFDRPVRDAIRDIGGSRFAAFMEGVSDLGSRWVIAALLLPAVAIAWRRCRQISIVLVVAFVLGFALEVVLKGVVDRPRPLPGQGSGASFPSGHVLAAITFWGLVPPWIYLVTQRRWAWALSAVVSALILAGVGLSRIHLGVHWPTDVIGGYLAGAIFLLAAEWSIRRPWRVIRCDACDFHPLRAPG